MAYSFLELLIFLKLTQVDIYSLEFRHIKEIFMCPKKTNHETCHKYNKRNQALLSDIDVEKSCFFPADHFKINNKNDNPKRFILLSA